MLAPEKFSSFFQRFRRSPIAAIEMTEHRIDRIENKSLMKIDLRPLLSDRPLETIIPASVAFLMSQCEIERPTRQSRTIPTYFQPHAECENFSCQHVCVVTTIAFQMRITETKSIARSGLMKIL